MKQVVKVRLYPSGEQAALLLKVLELSNQVANHISTVRFTKDIRKKQDLQRATYKEVSDYGLGSQLRILAAHKVHDAYKTLWANVRAGNLGKPGSKKYRRATGKPIHFRPDAAQGFDDRCLSWDYQNHTVRVWTTAGRIVIPYLGKSQHMKQVAQHRQGQSDLVHQNGKWYLHITVDLPTPAALPATQYLGVDLGITNIATDSNGKQWSGDHVRRLRQRNLKLRARLQKKATKSAKRLLKKRSQKEARFSTDVNHQISKHLVKEAKRTGQGIAIEDLTGIRDRVRQRGPKQRGELHSWSFHQLGGFIVYKAARDRVDLQIVDPAYTSQRCYNCGYIDRKNRTSQSRFHCQACHHTDNADTNAAKNIAQLGKQPTGCQSYNKLEVNHPHAA